MVIVVTYSLTLYMFWSCLIPLTLHNLASPSSLTVFLTLSCLSFVSICKRKYMIISSKSSLFHFTRWLPEPSILLHIYLDYHSVISIYHIWKLYSCVVGTRADSRTISVVSSILTLIVHKDINIFNKYVIFFNSLIYIYQRVEKSNLISPFFPSPWTCCLLYISDN